MKLAVVSASVDMQRANLVFASWTSLAEQALRIYIVEQGTDNRDWQVFGRLRNHQIDACSRRDLLGVVPAFALGVKQALHDGADVVACFHDDLEIREEGWDARVRSLFQAGGDIGLCGFGGAVGLGDADLYQTPYRPQQLARLGFRSNMLHAEAHGERTTETQEIVVLDGFSQIGRAEYWRGFAQAPRPGYTCLTCRGTGFGPSAVSPGRCAFCDGQENNDTSDHVENLFKLMQQWGVIHHFYDGMLGCFARRLGWKVWLLPVACHHHGGVTAVMDPRYKQWAMQFSTGSAMGNGNGEPAYGDAALWLKSHEIGYREFKDVLPLRLP